MFKDDTNYPNLVEENNLEAEPGFDETMRSAVVAKCLEWANGYRQYAGKWEEGVDTYYPQGSDYFNLPWPLPENLAYTNSTVLTYGEDGFPVGDLNWFPDKKADWITGIKKDNIETIPSEYTLSQNYPNPFNPSTTIKFSIPKAGNTKLDVFNILGQKVATLIDKELSAGAYQYQFDAGNLTSGIYFYKLETNDYTEIKKMMLLK